MKILLVGDPHVVVDELADAQVLLDLVKASAIKHSVDYVVFLGDQHHNHGVVRIEVMDFWSRNLEQLSDFKTIMLVGNHDRSLDTSTPETINGIRFIPWVATTQDFLDAVDQDTTKIICHQTFDGAKYDNGMFAPDGVPPSKVWADKIVSGHIHTPSKFSHVWYPGAPRWRTQSDVNVDRAIHVVDEDLDIVASIPTVGHCRALYRIQDIEGVQCDELTIQQPASVSVVVQGHQSYVTTKTAYWSEKGYSVVPIVVGMAKTEIKESEGIHVALQKHVSGFKPKYGTPWKTLQSMVAERIKL
jgi:predicted phosphodiesterase